MECCNDLISSPTSGINNYAQMAEKIGLQPQNFTLMKRGQREATIMSIAILCQDYGYSADYILTGKGGKVGADDTTNTILKELREIKTLLK